MKWRLAAHTPGAACALHAASVLAACAGADPGVPHHPQPPFAAAVRVPMPPPPAQIESLSQEPPGPDCRWVDGQWAWTSQRWDWWPGGWIQPPPDCRHSLPSLTWVDEQGTPALYYRPGRWYSVNEPKACPNPAPCGAASVRGSPPSSTVR
jgi:hypothetical protein